MTKRIVVTSLVVVFIFTALMHYATIAHAQGPWTLTIESAHDSPNPDVGGHTYNDNDSVTCNVSSPVVEGGISYTCTGWTGTGSAPASGSNTSVTFTITQDSNVTWNWQVTQRTLTVNSAHDSPNPPVGDNVYNDNDSLTCSVSSPILEDGISYTCTGWTGTGDVPSSGSGTSISFTISQDSSITWNWQITQRTLRVNSAHDSPNPPVGDNVYSDSDFVICSVSSPVVEGGVFYTCTGWTGTGDVPSSGSGTSISFTISQDSSITWNWQGTPVQHTLTVTSAHDSPSPPVGLYLYNDGSLVTCNVMSPVTEGSTVWTCTGWVGTGSVLPSGSDTFTTFAITQDSSITWTWQGTPVQHTLTVTSAHDSPSPPVGDHLYDDGSSVTCSVTSPATEGNVTYTCTGWSGTGDVPPSGSSTSVTFTISQNSTITWNWQIVQRRLTVASAHGSPSPSVGDSFYNDGSSVTCSVTSPVTEGGIAYVCTGWVGTGSVPSSGSGASVTFTISQDSTITWNWQIVQRRLTVASDHGHPNPSVGNHTYYDGTLITCSVPSPVKEGRIIYTCTGWTGTGSVPSSGSGASVTFTISQDSTITWNWHGVAVQYALTVTSARGNPSPAVGDHLYDDGSSVTCSVTSPATEGNVTYTCTGWSGTGDVPPSGSSTSVTFTISQNSTITWNWKVAQWTLTVASAHGNPNPAVGNILYNDGSSVTCSVSSPVVESGFSYTCIGWTGTGNVPPSGSDTSVTFTISQNSSITWNWQLTRRILTVTSAHDSPYPPVGDNVYNDNDSVICSVSSPVIEDGVSYTCIGWTGTGDVPSSGSGTSVSFTIRQDSSVTWNWQIVQRRLTVASAHDSPDPGAGVHMYNNGTMITCNVTSPVTEGGQIWICTGWVGTGSVPVSGSGVSVTFPLNRNSSITWSWQAYREPTIESSDMAGVQRDVFSLDETVCVVGSGFGASQTYSVYIVYDRVWFDGMNITGRVQAATASSDSLGNISLTVVWNKPLTSGIYDILVDTNGNGKYDAGVDALYSNKVIAATSERTPAILDLAGCFAALGAFLLYKRRHR